MPSEGTRTEEGYSRLLLVGAHPWPDAAGARGYSLSARQLGVLEQGEKIDWEAFVPRDVPDELMALLPELPYRPIRSLEVRGVVLSVLLALEVFIKRRAAVAPLRSSSSPYEDELFERNERKLAEATTTLVAAAQVAHDQLERGLGHVKAWAEYQLVSEFLRSFERRAGERPCDEGREPDAGTLEAVARALEVLACDGARET